MAKKKTMRIGGINIRVHSRHAPEEYTALWKMIYRTRSVVTTRGLTAMMIGGMRQLDETAGDESPIFGHFYKFVNIDPDEPWFDIEKQKPADEKDVKELVIPKRLKPNLKEIPYLLNVRKHQLYFLTGGAGDSATPGMVDALLDALCSTAVITSRFGEVSRTIMTRTGLVEELLLWPEIRQITVVLERPNPTDFDDDKRFEERMKRRKVSRELHQFTKAKGEDTIAPDEEMVDMFNRAVTDGVYEQRGVNPEGKVETASSTNYLREEIGTYDPDVQTQTDAFIDLATRRFG